MLRDLPCLLTLYLTTVRRTCSVFHILFRVGVFRYALVVFSANIPPKILAQIFFETRCSLHSNKLASLRNEVKPHKRQLNKYKPAVSCRDILGRHKCFAVLRFFLKQILYLLFSEYRRLFDRVVSLTHLNLRRLELGSETWGAQFREAMSVNGGDVENATTLDYIMHFFTFAWKVG